MSEPNANLSQKRYLIGSVLAPAVKLWLRSQVEQIEHLEVKIAGRNLQILNGSIPKMAIAAENVVYQGLHLSKIQIKGENIRIDLPQIIKGKPLRLLEPISISAELLLHEADFNASLGSKLLQDAVGEFFGPLLPYPIHLPSSQIRLNRHRLTLTATKPQPTILCMGLQMICKDKLQLVKPQLQTLSHPPSTRQLDSRIVDLGSDVTIEELTLNRQQLFCRGGSIVRSEQEEENIFYPLKTP